jgi:hypothetical protein
MQFGFLDSCRNDVQKLVQERIAAFWALRFVANERVIGVSEEHVWRLRDVKHQLAKVYMKRGPECGEVGSMYGKPRVVSRDVLDG